MRANYSSRSKNSTGKGPEAILITASRESPKCLEQREYEGDPWVMRLETEAEATSSLANYVTDSYQKRPSHKKSLKFWVHIASLSIIHCRWTNMISNSRGVENVWLNLTWVSLLSNQQEVRSHMVAKSTSVRKKVRSTTNKGMYQTRFLPWPAPLK